MGREVRMVPADWRHPQYTPWDAPGDYAVGRFKPLFDGGYAKAAADWAEEKAQWDAGYKRDYGGPSKWAPKGDDHNCSFEEWCGEEPQPDRYMPEWPADQRTHLMMYETTSEGTPISPAFATPEELARWLADNGASSFGRMTASYEEWLSVARGGWAPSMVIAGGVLMSGVEALADATKKETP